MRFVFGYPPVRSARAICIFWMAAGRTHCRRYTDMRPPVPWRRSAGRSATLRRAMPFWSPLSAAAAAARSARAASPFSVPGTWHPGMAPGYGTAMETRSGSASQPVLLPSMLWWTGARLCVCRPSSPRHPPLFSPVASSPAMVRWPMSPAPRPAVRSWSSAAAALG